MNVKGSVVKAIESLEASGFGQGSLGESRITPCGELYSIVLDDGVFSVLGGGISFVSECRNVFIGFKEMTKVTSHLSADLFSEVSRTQDSNFNLPIEIEYFGGSESFGIPFLAYSRLLNVITDLLLLQSVEKE